MSYMTNDLNFYTILQDTNIIIYLVDDSSVKAVGIGEGRIVYKISNNHTQMIELKNVFYIP